MAEHITRGLLGARHRPTFFISILSTALLVLLSGASALGAEKKDALVFGKVELNLLEQCAALDQKFEREGYVFIDPDLTAYVERVGRSVLPQGEPPERVVWRF